MKTLSLFALLLLCLVGSAQSITVTSPNGGEAWKAGYDKTITWTSTGVTNVTIDYSPDAVTWIPIATNIPNTGSYVWNVPGPASTTCLVRIVEAATGSAVDASNTYFIIGPVISVTPVPDQTICGGQSVQLAAGGTYIAGDDNSGGPPPPPPAISYSWSPTVSLSANGINNPVAAPMVTTSYIVAMTDGNGLFAYDTIVVNVNATPSVTITNPGDSILPDTLNITATGGTPPYTYQPVAASWITFPVITQPGIYSVAVTDSNGCTDVNSVNTNNPSITVLTPNGGETLVVGQSVPLTWSHIGNIPKVKIEVYSSIAFNWITVEDSIINTNTYAFTVPNVPNTTGKVRISDPYNAAVNDESDALFSIVASGTFSVNVSSSDVLCNGLNNGSISILAGNGTAPYQYSIDGGVTFVATNTFGNLPGGTYNIVVKDATNTYVYQQRVINEPAPLSVDSVQKQDVLCNGVTGNPACVYISGGTPPYSYLWLGWGTTGNCSPALFAGTFPFKYSDLNGCTDTLEVVINALSAINSQIIFGSPDSILVSVHNGMPPYSYVWGDGATGFSGEDTLGKHYNSQGAYVVQVEDANGCRSNIVRNYSITGDVWPGDANYDGTVDNNDLLPIGLAYGTTGNIRYGGSNQWIWQYCEDWSDTLANGTNYKHVDCNGNGTINADDTLAILLNYNLNHPRSGMDEPRGGVPMLRVQMVPDTLANGQTVIAHLLLGDALNTATNVYGLAFTFNYDVDVVDSTQVSIQFNNNSWLCNNAQDHIDIDKKFYGTGMIKTALTRIDQTTRSGNGEIGNVSLKITTGNINGKNLVYYAMHCYITDLVVIDNNGNYLAVDPGLDSATIEYEPTGISQLSINNGVGIYPNPTTDLLNISSKNSPMQQYTITNLLGEVVLQSTTEATQQTTINTAALAQGVYVIRIQAGNEEFTGRFTKQ